MHFSITKDILITCPGYQKADISQQTHNATQLKHVYRLADRVMQAWKVSKFIRISV